MTGRTAFVSWAVAAVVMAAPAAVAAKAQSNSATTAEAVGAAVTAISPKVVEWRRDFHQHPELGFAETRSAAIIADHLRGLGMEVRTGVGQTGVVGILRGGRPGRSVALRADMDALPVREATGLAFASTATGTYGGETVPVAHACGHDMHMAMLMGAAEVLAGMKDQISGTIVFIFQPAEEGAPPGEPMGGAAQMIRDGALDSPRPEAIFGLHVVPGTPGTIFYRPQGFMAAADRITITLSGKQTHGAWPWKGVDVISASSQIVQTLNNLTARTVDPTTTPMVFTIATMNAGVRYNIIPDSMTMTGTMRTFDAAQREDYLRRARAAVDHVAETYGATATFAHQLDGPLVYNDEALSAWLAAPLTEAAGSGKVNPGAPPTTVAEDFSAFQAVVPGVYYHLGASPDGVDPAQSAPNHSPEFAPNEAVLPLGVRAHVFSALRFLERE